MVKDAYKEVFKDINKVLIVLAHPDDMEIVCGGLIARLLDDKKEVRLVVTTNGGKGMQDKKGLLENEFATKRVQEQIEAGEILGISKDQNFNLQIPDGEVETNLEHIEKVVYHIREFKPDLIITHNPQDFIIKFFEESTWVNHRDHRNTGIIVFDAVYPYSRDRGFFTTHFSESNLEPHIVTKILVADSYTKESVKYFGTNGFTDKKKEALKKHVSAINPDYADDYIEENNIEGNYFEPFAYYEVY